MGVCDAAEDKTKVVQGYLDSFFVPRYSPEYDLFWGLDTGDLELARRGLEQGADINHADGFILFYAARFADLYPLTWCFDHGADAATQGGALALVKAARLGLWEHADQLISKGASATFHRSLALQFAEQHEWLRTVSVLVRHGADVRCLRNPRVIEHVLTHIHHELSYEDKACLAGNLIRDRL
ncbi:MAG: hypothetical protein NTY46_03250 [Candidatus Sumerlaeota bacterium]|nr:hypothetical protein [Candidatus Sumerlaeota bacterium]